ncbi:MAG: tetratricopeptide repeat protein [Planctomycetota bacterium]
MSRADNHEPMVPSKVGPILLVAITLVAYLPALRGGFIWDDQEYVVENPVLRDSAGLARIWIQPSANHELHYWPMTYSTFWVEYQFWGLRPFGYHLTNVLLHAVNAVWVWILLRRLEVPGAWLAAAVFALHPVRVESVAWIIERKDVLSGCFFLPATLAYIHFDRTRRLSAYGLAVGLFVCAMLSKSMAISLPVVILLLLWWNKDRLRSKDILPLVPFFLTAVVFALLDVRLARQAETLEFSLSIPSKLLVAGRALCFYTAKVCWPASLMAIYPRWETDAGGAWAYLYPAAALALAAILWLARHCLGKAPVVTALFLAATLAPVLGFVEFTFMKYSFVADRFAYLAAIGPATLLVAAATGAARRLRSAPRWLAPAAAGALVLVLGLLTWQQSKLYRDNETFWRATVQRNPRAWAAHYNLGVALAQTGWPPEEVIPHLLTALQVKPGFAEAHNRLGMEEAQRADFSAAVRHFSEALRIMPGFADAAHNLVQAHHEWALALAGPEQLDEAIEHFHQALRLDPERADVRYNLAVALAQQGRLEEAIAQLDEVLRRAPGDRQARALCEQLRAAGETSGAEPSAPPQP